MKKTVVLLIAVISILFLSLSTLLTGLVLSRRLSVSRYECDFGTEIKIAHLSDLHYPKNGISPDTIIEAVKAEAPDLIAITGDMADGSAKSDDLKAVLQLYGKLVEIAPVYAVIGNHEIGSPLLAEYETMCSEIGVTVMSDEYIIAEKSGRRICLYGVKDACLPDGKILSRAKSDGEITVLLAHRPEKINDYADMNFDVVLSGHTHGGQVGIFGKGLYAPDQGFFPKYSCGKYKVNSTVMFISRGLGNGNSDFRIFNPYEIIFVTL